jgi:polysaccharide biosynthesis protein PslC
MSAIVSNRVAPRPAKQIRVGLFIPVLNAGEVQAKRLASAILQQTRQPDEIMIADSESTDGSGELLANALGGRLLRVRRAQFDHGGTRNIAFSAMNADVYLFLTQDALPANSRSFELLVDRLWSDERAAVAYGRQLPHEGAGAYARHSRLFNYPASSARRTREDIPTLGIKAAFCSNSFAAYKREAMVTLGGFPVGMIFGEDTAATARFLEHGWSSLYVADAAVHHSHDYSLRQEFARYFDAGAFHARERWFTTLLSGPTREGVRFLKSEIEYVTSESAGRAMGVIIRNGIRWAGYRAGRLYRVIPPALRRRIGMNHSYWSRR